MEIKFAHVEIVWLYAHKLLLIKYVATGWKQSQKYDINILTNIPVSSFMRPTEIILRFQGLTMNPNKNT